MALIIKEERLKEKLQPLLDPEEELIEVGFGMHLAGLAFWRTKSYFIGLTNEHFIMMQVTSTQKVKSVEKFPLSEIVYVAIVESGMIPGAVQLEIDLGDYEKHNLTFNKIIGMDNADRARKMAEHLYELTKQGLLNIRFPSDE